MKDQSFVGSSFFFTKGGHTADDPYTGNSMLRQIRTLLQLHARDDKHSQFFVSLPRVIQLDVFTHKKLK